MLKTYPPLVEAAWYSATRPAGFVGQRGAAKRAIRARFLMTGILGPMTGTAVFALNKMIGGVALSGLHSIVHLQAYGPTYQEGAEAYGALNRPLHIPQGAVKGLDRICPSWPQAASPKAMRKKPVQNGQTEPANPENM